MSQMQGLAFKAAETALGKSVQGVLFLGFSPEGTQKSKEGEFLHALAHVLRSQDLSAALVPFQEAHSPASWLRASLDLREGGKGAV